MTQLETADSDRLEFEAKMAKRDGMIDVEIKVRFGYLMENLLRSKPELYLDLENCRDEVVEINVIFEDKLNV